MYLLQNLYKINDLIYLLNYELEANFADLIIIKKYIKTFICICNILFLANKLLMN